MIDRELGNYRPPIIEQVDLSGTWDTQSEVEAVLEKLKQLNIYQPGLLYSGFVGESSKAISSSDASISCATEDEFIDGGDVSPIMYVDSSHDDGAIAVYDPAKMLHKPDDKAHVYKIISSTALIAVLELKH